MFGIAGQLAYGSNKEALRGLTKIAAKEWGQYGICVNIVLPGAESPAAKAWAAKFTVNGRKSAVKRYFTADETFCLFFTSLDLRYKAS